MKAFPQAILPIACLLLPQAAPAQALIVDSDLADAYYFVDHYEVLIDRAPEQVWPHLLDFSSWMYEFSMSHVSGPRNGEGAILRIYEGQDFFFEITKIVPNRMIVGINHPSTMQGEESVGIAMFTLTELDGKTLVSNFVSREYHWTQQGPNPLRATRESAEFQESTRATWDTFLARLRELAE